MTFGLMENYWTKLIKSLMSDTSGADDYFDKRDWSITANYLQRCERRDEVIREIEAWWENGND